MIRAKFGRNPWDPAANPIPAHHGASSASKIARQTMSVEMVQIICKMYADDYCCLDMPVPEECQITCQ